MCRLIKFNILGLLALFLAACGGGAQDVGFDDQPLPEPEPEQVVLDIAELDDDLLIIDDDEPPLEQSALSVSPLVLYFDFDKAELKDAGLSSLEENLDSLVNSTGIIRLEGHADERGTTEYNLALGERRAAAVRDFLEVQGVPGERIETISYGEEFPAADGQDEEAYALNRRVELKLN
jgi:peptidoglycan-associated lipoprotein